MRNLARIGRALQRAKAAGLCATRWMWRLALVFAAVLALPATAVEVEDLPTRPDVTVRTAALHAMHPVAVVLLFAGGDGFLQLDADGLAQHLRGNFLVRSRARFVGAGLTTVVVDAPSDRQSAPYLSGFRERAEHVADIQALIAHWRARTGLPVWLVGTSRGTQSVAYAATQLQGAAAPDGIVLSSTIFADKHGRPVPRYALGKVGVPVLMVHHAHDECPVCNPGEAQTTLARFSQAPRKALLMIDGGISEGDPCEGAAHHGYNGVEDEAVAKIAEWIKQGLARPSGADQKP